MSSSSSDSGSSSSSSSGSSSDNKGKSVIVADVPAEVGASDGGVTEDQTDDSATVPPALPHFYEIVAAYAWSILDVNKDGVIDVEEWLGGMAKLVPSVSPEQIASDLKSYDENNDGEIDFGEFCAWMKAWDTTGQCVIREDQVRSLVEEEAKFAVAGEGSDGDSGEEEAVELETKGGIKVVDWDGFLSIARKFLDASKETTVLDRDFGRQLLAAVSLEPEHVDTLTFGEALIALCTMWHGPPQGSTVAFYVKNVWQADGRA